MSVVIITHLYTGGAFHWILDFGNVSLYNLHSDQILHSSSTCVLKAIHNTKGPDYLSEVNALRLKDGFKAPDFIFGLLL